MIALDLDETTLSTGAILTDNTRKAITTLLAWGVEVVIASGRAFGSLPESVLQIPGLYYAITSNGAAVYRICDGARLYGFTLSAAAVSAVLQVTDGEPVLLEAFVDGIAYADSRYVADPGKYGCSPHGVEYIHRTRNPVDNFRSFLRKNCGKLDSIDIICSNPEEKAYYAEKVAAFAPDTYITTSCRHLLEISDSHAGKATALRRICEERGIPASQCAAFGNAENDVDMLRFAGLGVSVANGSPACLAAADIICGTNDNDGVANVLWEIIKKKRGC